MMGPGGRKNSSSRRGKNRGGQRVSAGNEEMNEASGLDSNEMMKRKND
jgi:hypothetical protein